MTTLMTHACFAFSRGAQWRVLTMTEAQMLTENRNLRRDMVLARRHRTNWRTRQAAIWADREHKALMAEVAW